MAGQPADRRADGVSMRWTRPEQFRSEDVTPTPWAQAQSGLERAGTYCLATLNPDGRPHVVPVLAVVVDGVVHFCASDRSRKARNIAADPRCTRRRPVGRWRPTAGPPPYRVHKVVPATVFGFPTDEKSVPTRWP
jgi:hypothetical protein